VVAVVARVMIQVVLLVALEVPVLSSLNTLFLM
jgi:hypothetical protein